MTVLIALIEKTVNTCIHREYKVVGDNVKPGIIRKIQHITMGLILLGIKKLIIFRAGVFRQITMTIDTIIQGEISINPWFTERKYHPVLISTIRLKQRITHSPFHTVLSNTGIRNHSYLRNML